MTDLYVANTTKQNHDFTYRRPEASFHTVIKIPAGTQAIVVKDSDSSEVDRIIAQHRRYGLVPASEAAKSKRFVGLCYSIDREIKFKDMKIVFENNDKVLEKQGEENVKAVAVAVNTAIDDKLKAADIPNEAAHVAIEVKEENEPGKDTTVAVGVQVVKDGQQAGQGRRGGRR